MTLTESQIWIRSNYYDLIALGWQQIQQHSGNTSRVTLTDGIKLFMELQTQEKALPVMMVAYSIAHKNINTDEDRDISKLITEAIIKRFNDLN